MPVISGLSATAILFQEGLTFHVASWEWGGGLFSSLGPQVRISEGETGLITSKICLSKPGHSDYGLKSLSCLVRQSLVTPRTKTFSYLELADHTELIRFAFLF